MKKLVNEMDDMVSVLMGVYNCEDTIQSAVASIQGQTYTNWELIICDDGSTDGTFELAQRLAEQDHRIQVLKNKKNEGLNVTLNRCFRASKGNLIARMDGDDESLPERFEKEVSFLHNHPEFALISSPMILFDEKGVWGRTYSPEYPTPEQVVSGTPICHAPVMIRRDCLETVGGYSESVRTMRVEDVDLWIKLYSAGFRGYNIQVPLYRMRNDQNALRRRKYRYRINSTYVRLQGCRKLHLGFTSYFKALKPLIIGLVPTKIRSMLRKNTIATKIS